MGGQEARLRRIEDLFRSIRLCSERGVGCDKKKLIAQMCLKEGINEKKVLEYLNVILNIGCVSEDFGELWFVALNPKEIDKNSRPATDEEIKEFNKPKKRGRPENRYEVNNGKK